MYQPTDRGIIVDVNRHSMRLGIVVAAMLGSSLLASCSASDPTQDETTKKFDAERVCKDFVKDQLKAPSTADFSDVTTTGAVDRYTVVGNVDSENSFSAMIRNTFVCKVRLDAAAEKWHLVSMQGLGN